jgi:site-specific DNA-methyltransferase (adenine-specific)
MATNSAAKPGRNVRRHYPTMKLADIAALPVREIVADQAILFMWITGPFLMLGAHLPIMSAWGFKPSAVGFTWIKTNKCAPALWLNDRDLFMGGGFTTRKNAEFCLIGKRGRSMRQDAGVHEVVIAPVMAHSQKPLEVRRRIERYVGTGLRMAELNAREEHPGWESWGNEVGKIPPQTKGQNDDQNIRV